MAVPIYIPTNSAKRVYSLFSTMKKFEVLSIYLLFNLTHLKLKSGEFPGGPVVRIQSFYC